MSWIRNACSPPQAFGAGGLKLLSLREEKFSGESIVTSVDRRSAIYTEFRPWPVAVSAAAAPPPPAVAAEPEEPGSLLMSQPEGLATGVLQLKWRSMQVFPHSH